MEQFKKGDRVIVEWENIDPNKGLVGRDRCVIITRKYDYYEVMTRDGRRLYAKMSKTELDVQYYREQRLNKLLDK